jgi:hypothetical protein
MAKMKRGWTILVAALGALAAATALWRWSAGRSAEATARARREFVARWSELDRRGAGPVWRCLFNNDVDVDRLDNASHVRRLIETAYAGQKATFAEHLLSACVPLIERARQAAAGQPEPPPALRAELAAYLASLARLESALALYGERMKARQPIKELDDLVVERARAWYSEARPTAGTIAYHHFLTCAVPGLDGLRDGQAIYQLLAESCFKQNPLPFMDRVRKDCGPLVQKADPRAAPPESYAATRQRLQDPEARQVQAWESCSDIARAQQRMQDAEPLLAAVTDYLAARPRR